MMNMNRMVSRWEIFFSVISVPIIGPGVGSLFYAIGNLIAPTWMITDIVVGSVIALIIIAMNFCIAADNISIRRVRTDIDRQKRVYEAAHARGDQLLISLLDDKQKVEYRADRQITVDLPGGKATIGMRISGVQWEMPGCYRRQCVSVPFELCKEDDLIAKLLWLRNDPDALAAVSAIDLPLLASIEAYEHARNRARK